MMLAWKLRLHVEVLTPCQQSKRELSVSAVIPQYNKLVRPHRECAAQSSSPGPYIDVNIVTGMGHMKDFLQPDERLR